MSIDTYKTLITILLIAILSVVSYGVLGDPPPETARTIDTELYWCQEGVLMYTMGSAVVSVHNQEVCR